MKRHAQALQCDLAHFRQALHSRDAAARPCGRVAGASRQIAPSTQPHQSGAMRTAELHQVQSPSHLDWPGNLLCVL
eukprot:scaffold94143_cov31-Tisochrysis_lutea.AAC.2